MFTYDGKPLSFLKFDLEPTTFKGGKSVYYQGKGNEILNTTIVVGYRLNSMFKEGCYGITATGDSVYYPAEIVDWNFELVSKYLTEKYPKLFTLERGVLRTNLPSSDNDFEVITTSFIGSDGIKLLSDRFIKYKALRVEHLDELAKEVEVAMNSKNELKNESTEESTESPTSEKECFIRSESTPTDKQLNKYYVRFHYIDDNGKENKFRLLVHWDANSLLKLEIDLREYFKIEQRLFMEIDNINLVEIAGK